MSRQKRPRFTLVPQRSAEFADLTDAQVLTEFNRAEADIKRAYALLDAAPEALVLLFECTLCDTQSRSRALESECYSRGLDPFEVRS